MNYNTVFSATVSAERIARKIFSVNAAIALSIFVLELACDACESGQIVRGWYEVAKDRAPAEFEPCAQVVRCAIAWCFNVDRCWSVQLLPVTLAANAEFWAEVKADYSAVCSSAIRFAVASVDRACELSTVGVRAMVG